MRRSFIFLALVCVSTAAAAIQPGQWQSSSRMSDISLPASLPAQVTQMIRQQMGRATEATQCITQQDIDEAPERMFRQSQGDCRYTSFDMSGGRLNAVAQCEVNGKQMTMTMTGTHSDSAYDMDMQMQGDMGMGQMTMSFHTTGERIGACG